MSTSDKLHYQDTMEKLGSIIQFSSSFSESPPKGYNTVLVDDPFEKEKLLKTVPASIQESLERLIDKFEASLQRVLNHQSLPDHIIIAQYLSRLNSFIQRAISLSKSGLNEPRGTDAHTYGSSTAPFSVEATPLDVFGEKDRVATPDRSLNQESGSKRNKKRTKISKETKAFLEAIFVTKRAPNGKERRRIADKCGLTPLQVRVWFTNKRMRCKE